VGLEGFYVVERGQRFPWQADPVLEALVGKSVEVKGTLVPAGKGVFDRTYPLPTLIVEEIREIVY
jgi:hypothetical protein